MKKRILITLVVLLSVFGFAINLQAIPIQWSVEDGGNGHYYEILDDGSGAMSWETANTLAHSVGGELASITSADENTFFINIISNDQHHSLYLGAFRTEADNWQWTDGEIWGFTYWDTGEPQNQDYNYACIVAFSNIAMQDPSGADILGGWNDILPTYNHLNYGYVVEYVPEPATILLLALGGLVFRKRK